METYVDMKTRHGDEIGSFDGLFFAFSNKQLEEGLEKIKSTIKDIVSIGEWLMDSAVLQYVVNADFIQVKWNKL